jgi:hypothetical protein
MMPVKVESFMYVGCTPECHTQSTIMSATAMIASSWFLSFCFMACLRLLVLALACPRARLARMLGAQNPSRARRAGLT